MSWLGSDDFDAAVVLKETNSVRLWVEVLRLAKHHVDTGAPLIVTPEQLCRFNSIAMHGLISRAGSLRDDDNGIFGAAHKPPPHQAVPQLVDECCAYINREHQSPLHPAAYALWRINFIHPFDDGNGRVSRALCYLVFAQRLVLCLRDVWRCRSVSWLDNVPIKMCSRTPIALGSGATRADEITRYQSRTSRHFSIA